MTFRPEPPRHYTTSIPRPSKVTMPAGRPGDTTSAAPDYASAGPILTSSSAKRGLFTRQDFVYDAEKDHYTCPAGEHLTRGHVRSDRRGDIDHYRHLTACFTCQIGRAHV